MIHVFISSLEWDDISDLGRDLLLPLFTPLICELFIILFLCVLLLPLAHHLVELIFIQAILIVPEPLKHFLLVFLHFLHGWLGSQLLLLEACLFNLSELCQLLRLLYKLLVLNGIGSMAQLL